MNPQEDGGKTMNRREFMRLSLTTGLGAAALLFAPELLTKISPEKKALAESSADVLFKDVERSYEEMKADPKFTGGFFIAPDGILVFCVPDVKEWYDPNELYISELNGGNKLGEFKHISLFEGVDVWGKSIVSTNGVDNISVGGKEVLSKKPVHAIIKGDVIKELNVPRTEGGLYEQILFNGDKILISVNTETLLIYNLTTEQYEELTGDTVDLHLASGMTLGHVDSNSITAYITSSNRGYQIITIDLTDNNKVTVGKHQEGMWVDGFTIKKNNITGDAEEVILMESGLYTFKRYDANTHTLIQSISSYDHWLDTKPIPDLMPGSLGIWSLHYDESSGKIFGAGYYSTNDSKSKAIVVSWNLGDDPTSDPSVIDYVPLAPDAESIITGQNGMKFGEINGVKGLYFKISSSNEVIAGLAFQQIGESGEFVGPVRWLAEGLGALSPDPTPTTEPPTPTVEPTPTTEPPTPIVEPTPTPPVLKHKQYLPAIFRFALINDEIGRWLLEKQLAAANC